jgi:hypothetical protein
LIEDPTISRGGVRIEAAGSQIDATVQTRWRRVMDNLSRNIAMGWGSPAADGTRHRNLEVLSRRRPQTGRRHHALPGVAAA